MKKISLTQNKFAIVDDEDYDRLMTHKWLARRDKKNFYAARTVMIGGKKTTAQMHREILYLSFGDGIEIDHRNGDGLDNRKENLRAVSSSLNSYNRRMQHNNTSGYRGVSWHGRDEIWQAYIKFQNVRKHLGYFLEKVDAARAYDCAARKYYGENAILNLPLET